MRPDLRAKAGRAPSGRNADFMLKHHSHGGIKNLDAAKNSDRLFQTGQGYLRDIVEQHQIRCQWNDWGQIYVSASTPGEAHLDEVDRRFPDTRHRAPAPHARRDGRDHRHAILSARRARRRQCPGPAGCNDARAWRNLAAKCRTLRRYACQRDPHGRRVYPRLPGGVRSARRNSSSPPTSSPRRWVSRNTGLAHRLLRHTHPAADRRREETCLRRQRVRNPAGKPQRQYRPADGRWPHLDAQHALVRPQ